jgi:hypothetical protein
LEVKVTLRNPLDKNDYLDYYIVPNDTQLAQDWITALKETLQGNLKLQKEFCFLGFPNSPRTIEYLCDTLNAEIEKINNYDFTQHGLEPYIIEEWFHPNTVRFPDTYPIENRTAQSANTTEVQPLGLNIKHSIMNSLHNHFERLEGTIEDPSPYGQVAPTDVRHAIGNLNHLCHELESLILSQRKARVQPEWVRPSQIITFDHRKRYELTDEHRQGFLENGYDREFGHVYMHWTQIGKTLIEVFRDEGAPELTEAICEAITHLRYYSGEFDLEWAKSVTRNDKFPWQVKEQIEFDNWLLKYGYDPRDPKLSLGYLHIGQVDLDRSFGTQDMISIWRQLETHLDIYSIEVDGVKNTFDYCWNDQ